MTRVPDALLGVNIACNLSLEHQGCGEPQARQYFCTGISAASGPTLPTGNEDDDDLDMLVVHVDAGQHALACPGDGDGAASLEEEDAEGDQHLAVAWLDAVVRGVNLLPGAKDSLLLVILLTAVRRHLCCTP